jgi:hypothetical protein
MRTGVELGAGFAFVNVLLSKLEYFLLICF